MDNRTSDSRIKNLIFFGVYLSSLERSRLRLPSAFRRIIERLNPRDESGLDSTAKILVTITPGPEQALSLRPLALRSRTGSRQAKTSKRDYTTVPSPVTFVCSVDRYGRLTIPRRLREHAGIARDVIIMGAVSEIQIWARETWEQKAATAAVLDDGEMERVLHEFGL
jgi:DNA-binding transcriptional regulator/RsmH inhibitor MraZ